MKNHARGVPPFGGIDKRQCTTAEGGRNQEPELHHILSNTELQHCRKVFCRLSAHSGWLTSHQHAPNNKLRQPSRKRQDRQKLQSAIKRSSRPCERRRNSRSLSTSTTNESESRDHFSRSKKDGADTLLASLIYGAKRGFQQYSSSSI